jgi:choline dehydrogenase-like flavoprotein
MDCDVLIIGSGFGAITACRLAQKGAKVRVLERFRTAELAVSFDPKMTMDFTVEPDNPSRTVGALAERITERMTP